MLLWVKWWIYEQYIHDINKNTQTTHKCLNFMSSKDLAVLCDLIRTAPANQSVGLIYLRIVYLGLQFTYQVRYTCTV